MTDKLGYGDNIGLGRLTTMKEISNNDNDNDNDNDNKESKIHKPTRIIRIHESTYRRLIFHSQKFYNVENYSQILENLLNDFESHNKDKTWRDMNES